MGPSGMFIFLFLELTNIYLLDYVHGNPNHDNGSSIPPPHMLTDTDKSNCCKNGGGSSSSSGAQVLLFFVFFSYSLTII